jgi:hypothetical protein
VIPQLWHAIGEVKRRGEEKGWLTRWLTMADKRALLELVKDGECYWVGAVEHSGPLQWHELEKLLKQLGEGKHLILLTTGWLPQTTLSEILRHPQGRQVALVTLNFPEQGQVQFRGKMFSRVSSAPFDLVKQVFQEEGVVLEEETCDHCSKKPVSACHVCQSPLCRNHFMLCPVCRLYFCHPDAKDCFFQHKC